MHGTAAASELPADKTEENYAYLGLLGRVKKALASVREISVPAQEIRAYADQPREYFEESHILGLLKSIDAGGQTTRGMIREKPGTTRYELVDGECRWRAILRIPESRRPLYKADLIEADDEVVQYLIAGVANFNRRGHTAVEVMRTIDRMVGFKLPMEEIASLLGISPLWAYQMYGLRNLTPEVLALIDPKIPIAQRLPVTAAIHISKIEAKFQFSLAERVISKDVSLGRLRGEVVRVAQRAGSPIRVREIEPRRHWESFGNQIEVMSRTSRDVEENVKKREVRAFARQRPEETEELLRKLNDTRNTINRIEADIRKNRK